MSTESRLRAHLQQLQHARNPYTHAQAHHQARAYIAESLEQQGRTVELQRFETDLKDRQGTPVFGVNILSGHEQPSHLLVAHYDTVDHSPGADDNTSAVATALEVAGESQQVAVLFCDLEEVGLLGARHFVTTERWKTVLTVVLESVGFWSPTPGSQSYPAILPAAFPNVFKKLQERDFRGDFWALLHLDSESDEASTLVGHLRQEIISVNIPQTLLGSSQAASLRDFGRSDHLAFWEAQRRCLMITDSANFRNPHYHQPSDTADTLDFEAMSTLTEDLTDYFLATSHGSGSTRV